MAATMDTPMPHHEDLNLMGLQELDSHLSIFETSNQDRDSSTPGARSNSGFGDSTTFDQHYNTIIVESPTENYAPNIRFEVGSRARFADQKFNHIIKYVLCSLFPVL
jgi:lysine-specific histone demethylase 1